MDFWDALQWPAMVITIAASWLVGSKDKHRRNWGFWIFLLSNAVWIAWAYKANAPALIGLQIALSVMNIRGAMKTEKAA